MAWLVRAVVAMAAWLTLAAASAAQVPTAEDFSADPAVRSVALSPDGRHVAMIQSVDAGLAIVVVDWRSRQARPIQLARYDRGVFFDWVAWKDNNRLLFAAHQRVDWSGPDDTWYDIVRRVYAMDRDGANVTQMFEGQMRRLAAADYAPMHLVDILRDDPENVLFGTWGQRGYTVYRANVNTGRATVVDDDSGWETGRMYVDGDGNPVMRVEWLANGAGYRYFRRPPQGGRWQLAHEVRRSTVVENRDFSPISAGPGPGLVYVAARPDGQEFQSIYLYNTATGELGPPVYEHGAADADRIRVDPNDQTLLAGCGQVHRWECRATDPQMQRHFDAIMRYFEDRASFTLIGVSLDKTVWLLVAEGPTIPATAYVYDLNATEIRLIGSEHPQIPRDQLLDTAVVSYTARDGAQLWGYLTLPRDTRAPPPLIVMPHGGPAARDSYGYNPRVQFLATRGYAVFQPNFRGSEGSGRTFAAAGHRQWGRRMQDDVIDGVQHLVSSGVVDGARMCIVGASYGGYVALAAGAFTPDLFKCVVAIAPVSDLIQVLNEERMEGRNSIGYAYWTQVIGDPNRDRDELIAMSPARHTENFRAPVLLIHGSDDYTVRIEQSETMRNALQRAGREVRFVRVEHEPHYFYEPANRRRLLEEIEAFVAQHIGRAQ